MTDGETGEVDNVLLLVVDALRTDRVGAMAGDRTASLTPNIDELAHDGELFERCFSCVNATDSSMTSIMTGLYPTRHGVINHGKNVTEQERRFVSATSPLPELLKETHRSIGVDMLGRWHKRGFDEYFMDRSEGWIEDPGTRPTLPVRAARSAYAMVPKETLLRVSRKAISLTPEPVPSVAESIYYDHLSSKNPYSTVNRLITRNKGYLEANWVRTRVVDAVRNERRKWFVLGHFWDTHLPYRATDEHLDAVAAQEYPRDDEPIDELVGPVSGSSWALTLRRMADENGWTTTGDVLRAYDASIRLVDEAIGDIVQTLKTRGVYDETAVIVTADHGESLLEHDVLFDHHGLYDPTIHVPLIVKAPGFEGSESGFVQHTELVPTILELTGTAVDTERFDGGSLVPENGGRALRDTIIVEEGNAARKRAIRTDSHKYIRRLDDRDRCRYCGVKHASDEELYLLDDDPTEAENRVESHREVAERLGAKMDEFIESIPDPTERSVRFEEDEAVLKRLEHIGYK